MMIPVRCMSCGKPIGGLWEAFRSRVEKGEQPGVVLDDLGIDRYCCRTLMMTHRDIIKDIASFRV